MMNADAEAGLLQTCPNCSYCLRGLKIEQRCPECGQLFDRRWQVFGGMSRWSALGFWRRTGAILVQVGFAAFLADWFLHTKAKGYFSVLDVFMALWVAGELTSLWYLFSRPSAFVGVGPAGVSIGKLKTGEVAIYPWVDVQGVSLGKDNVLVLGRTDNMLVLDCTAAELKFDVWRGNNRDASRCVDYIEDYLDGLRQSEPGPATPSV